MNERNHSTTDPSPELPAPLTTGDRLPLLAGLGYVLLLPIIFTVLYYFDVIDKPEKVLSLLSLVFLMHLAFTNIYAYRFYEDLFFFFVSVGWFANALYLVLEFYSSGSKNLWYSEKVFLFAIVTNIPFYVAIFSRRKRPFAGQRCLRTALLWLVPLVAMPLVSFLLGDLYELSDATEFMVFASAGVPFSAWLLYNIGRQTRKRFFPQIHGHGATILPWTFYLYAGLQFLYFVVLVPGWGQVVMAAFYFAFMLKVANILSLISIMTVTSREFIQAKAQLEERSDMEEIGRIASSIEHDIKTPLTMMQFELGQMRSKFQSYPEIQEALNAIEEERRRIYAISQVIPYLRGDRQYFERFMEKLDVREVVYKAIKNVKKDMHLDPTTFFFRVEGRAQFVKCHRPMLEQALVNIMKNSVEAVRQMGPKTGVVEVCVGQAKAERMVSIMVKDNGCGIAAENIPNLTTLYTTKRHIKPNSGIGLFIVSRILKVHDGLLEIKSKVGEGTSVRLLLPEWTAPKADFGQVAPGATLKSAQT